MHRIITSTFGDTRHSIPSFSLIAEPSFSSITSSVSFEQSSFEKIVSKVSFSDSDTLPSMVAVAAFRASVVSRNLWKCLSSTL